MWLKNYNIISMIYNTFIKSYKLIIRYVSKVKFHFITKYIILIYLFFKKVELLLLF